MRPPLGRRGPAVALGGGRGTGWRALLHPFFWWRLISLQQQSRRQAEPSGNCPDAGVAGCRGPVSTCPTQCLLVWVHVCQLRWNLQYGPATFFRACRTPTSSLTGCSTTSARCWRRRNAQRNRRRGAPPGTHPAPPPAPPPARTAPPRRAARPSSTAAAAADRGARPACSC